MKVFLDTNIILDLLLEREGWEDSAQIINLQEKGSLQLCVSVLTMANVAYVYKKSVGDALAVANLKYLSVFFEVLPMDGAMMDEAISSRSRDFEDCLQAISAGSAGCDAIITRNTRDYGNMVLKNHTLPSIFSPASFLSQIS